MTGMVAEEREKVRPVAWARTNWQWIATAALCLLGVVNSWFLAIADRPSWNVDFNQFFVASKLAGTGELYNWDLLRSGQNQYHERAVPTGRLPVFPAIFKAISVFGYMPARIAWLLICAACALWAASVWPGADRKVLLILICWSLPLTIGLSFGQDSAVILAFFAAGLVLMHKKWDFAAGLVFSCMLLKFHLTAGVIVLVLARKAWRTVGGGIVGTAALLLASFGVEGRDWPNRWLAISRLPLFDPAPERMPNLRGLVHALPHPMLWYVAIVLVLLIFVVLAVRRSPLGYAGAIALGFSLIVAPHGYAYDGVLLAPLLGYTIVTIDSVVLKVWGMIIATPIAFFLLVTDWPGWGRFFIVGFVMLAIVALTVARVRRSRPAPAGLAATAGN